LSSKRYDAVIVGAGFTGLSAALALRDAGRSFVVLEARDRVGGRVEAMVNGLGEAIDTGGQFLCEDMPEVMALAKQHGKTFVESYIEGGMAVQPGPSGESDFDDLYERVTAIRDRMNGIDPDDPSIDGLSVGAWLDKQPDRADAKSGFQSSIEGLWCQPIENVPLWYLISNDRRINNEVFELQYFLKETMHSLAADLARPLGASLRLGCPVDRIETGEGGLVVHAGGESFSAREVIVSVPPVVARRIVFAPPLPADTRHALEVWKSGTVIKLLLRYREPFWRSAGLSGSVFWLEPHGLYACDASRDDDHAALVVFVGGRLALEWGALGEDGLRQALLAKLSKALGPDAAQPLDMLSRDWSNDRWSGGAYSDVVADPAARDAEDVLRRGAGPVSFACSELSPSFPGYIEGAIIAGRIGARVVVDRLKERV
jgi:monoamine oxidase